MKSFIKPGQVKVCSSEETLQSVVTFGVVVCIYHEISSTGGISHFLFPRRRKDKPSTALYAAPSVASLFKPFAHYEKSELEIHIFGGASLKGADSLMLQRSKENIEVVTEILNVQGFENFSIDAFGHRGRKIIFNSFSGEIAMAKVNNIRKEDWMLSEEGAIERHS